MHTRYKLSDIVIGLFLTFIVSGFLFPVGFRGLPESLNSKQILAVLGVFFFVFNKVHEKSFVIERIVLVSFIIAVSFSVWCFFSCVQNSSVDYTYAKYFLSFFVWIAGAYGVSSLVRMKHGYINIALLTDYLTLACIFQCACALLVDNVPSFQSFVDNSFYQDVTPKRVGRLYGIGCSLDSGGVRIVTVLLLIAHQLSKNERLIKNVSSFRLYILAFLVISVIGNMIARTTSVGMALGLAYMLVSYGISKAGTLSKKQIRFYSSFAIVTTLSVCFAVYMYNVDPGVRRDFRFAFEAFFNYFETGEFRTSSTDRLNEVMWIWPKDSMTWMIGDAQFEHFVHGTDIGYCRFTWYCGLIGLAIFSLFFVYNSLAVGRRFKNAGLLSLILLATTFIIWLKVSTDIFFIYALLFCIDADTLEEDDLREDDNLIEYEDFSHSTYLQG